MGMVHDLTDMALGNDVSLEQLLKTALVVARRLKSTADTEWIKKELNGYEEGQRSPPYRTIPCELWVTDSVGRRYSSTVDLSGIKEVDFQEQLHEQLYRQVLYQPVAVLVGLARATNPLGGQVPPLGMRYLAMVGFDFQRMHVVKRFASSGVLGVLDQIRHAVLDWSLALEDAGVEGEAQRFSEDERQRVEQGAVHIHIGSIQGSVGTIGTNSGESHGIAKSRVAMTAQGDATYVERDPSTPVTDEEAEQFRADITAILHVMVDRLDEVDAKQLAAMKAIGDLEVQGTMLSDLPAMVETAWGQEAPGPFKTGLKRLLSFVSGTGASLTASAIWSALGLGPTVPL